MKKIISLAESLIAKFPLVWQFFKFCSVGITNLAIYLGIYWLLTRLLHWHYLPASAVSFAIAVTWSFYLNLKWTFMGHGGNRRQQYVKFIIANLICLGLNLLLLKFFIDSLKIYDLIAQLLQSVIVAFFNFGINRFWTFKKT